MTREIYFLFFINICSAIGYSLIAPLYSFEASKRDIKENMCGIIISIFAISNFFSTPFIPSLISKYGRKKIFYAACILEAGCTMIYGLLLYVKSYFFFLGISVVSRFFHGIGASFSATLGKSCIKFISLLCDGLTL
jgi:MFS family permease